jgi:hypothetical protein
MRDADGFSVIAARFGPIACPLPSPTFVGHCAATARIGKSVVAISSHNPLRDQADLAVADPGLSDRAALGAAVDVVRRHPERAVELEALVRERGWSDAAKVAAFDAQSRALRLPVWESPPCVARVRGKDRAARLLRRMLRRGISRWHPNPLAAIEQAGPAR